MGRVAWRVGGIAVILLLAIYAWPAWNMVSDQHQGWIRARRESARRLESARRARFRVPDVLIAKDFPGLETVLDSTHHVDVYRLLPLALQLRDQPHHSRAPNGMWIDKRIPVEFETWWPRFEQAFLSKPLMYTNRSPDSQNSPIYVRCSGSSGPTDILLVYEEHGSHLEISWADSSGSHVLKRQAICTFGDADDSTISRLRVGIAID